MLHPELARQISQEQHRDWLIAAEQRRQAAIVSVPQAAISRRVAAPLGATLVRLGARLLRYGRGGTPTITRPYRASARSIRLN